jgi:hypothetical protein
MFGPLAHLGERSEGFLFLDVSAVRHRLDQRARPLHPTRPALRPQKQNSTNLTSTSNTTGHFSSRELEKDHEISDQDRPRCRGPSDRPGSSRVSRLGIVSLVADVACPSDAGAASRSVQYVVP